MPRAALGLAVLVFSGAFCPVLAQTLPPSPVVGQPALNTSLPTEPIPSRSLPPEPVGASPVTNLPPILGAPVVPGNQMPMAGTIRPVAGEKSDSQADTVVVQPGIPVPNNNGSPNKTRGAVLALQNSNAYLPPAPSDPPASQPSFSDPNDFLNKRSAQREEAKKPSPNTERSSDKFGGEFGETLDRLLGNRNEWFKSDHAFDGFISPVTNPFLFEDPRALTEVRPIFMIQKIPSSQPDFHGGNVVFFGTQLRLAVTDRLSFVIEKLGFESVNPGSGSAFSSETGFAEFWIGPKYTFIRNENTGSILAGGLQFQIPTGSHGNFQDTGTLSMVPYVSYAQSFLRDLSIGSFNSMFSTGYSFSVNNERSDYFYLSAHVDMDILNQHHWYPLLEMNWFAYTTNGKSTPVGIEGQDSINFGGHAAGQGLLSFAFGGRYKINECYQFGTAFEFPIAGPRDINAFRWTLDFIWRY